MSVCLDTIFEFLVTLLLKGVFGAIVSLVKNGLNWLKNQARVILKKKSQTNKHDQEILGSAVKSVTVDFKQHTRYEASGKVQYWRLEQQLFIKVEPTTADILAIAA